MLYRRERRSEFNWVLHGLFPLLSTLGMVLVLLFSLNIIGGDPLTFQPGKLRRCRRQPFNIAVIFVGVWLIAGAALVLYLRATQHEDWMAKAAEAASERPATDEELKEIGRRVVIAMPILRLASSDERRRPTQGGAAHLRRSDWPAGGAAAPPEVHHA